MGPFGPNIKIPFPPTARRTSMTQTEEDIAMRLVKALEKMAANQETMVAIAAEQLALTKELHAKAMMPKEPPNMSGMFDSILKNVPKEFLSAIGMSVFGSATGNSEDEQAGTPLPPESMPDAEHLCRCAHKKENHLQGDGPCVADGRCPCHRYDAMEALSPPALSMDDIAQR